MVNNVASDPPTSHLPGSDQKRPEAQPAASPESIRDKMLDKTLADSFPTSDPPSSIPDPCVEDFFREEEAA